MSDLHLEVNIHGLFVAGTDTTSTTLRWAILYLTHNQDVQKNCRAEIDKVIGRDRLPSIDLDKGR
jgi:cytochrome P450 family 2 subfamily J